MKKQIKVLLLIIASVPFSAFAQDSKFHIGSRIGLGETWMASNYYNEDPKGALDFQVGGSSLLMLNQNLGLSADLLFNYHGGSAKGVENSGGVVAKDYTYTDDYRFINLQVPLQLRFTFGQKKLHPYATGGASLNFNLLSTSSRTFDNEAYNDNNGYSDRKFDGLEPISFQYVGGLGLLIDTDMGKSYFIEVKYQGPFQNAGKIGVSDLSFTTIGIACGYYF